MPDNTTIREVAPAGTLFELGTPEPVSSLRPGLPWALDAVLAKALARDPSERYATCEQFINACAEVHHVHSATAPAAAGETVADIGTPLSFLIIGGCPSPFHLFGGVRQQVQSLYSLRSSSA